MVLQKNILFCHFGSCPLGGNKLQSVEDSDLSENPEYPITSGFWVKPGRDPVAFRGE